MPTLTQPHFEAVLRFSRQNAVATCTLYYASPGSDPTPEQMAPLADTIAAHFSPQLQACFEPTTKWDGVSLTYHSSDLLLEASSTEDPVVGTATAGDVLPEEDAVVIQRRTGLPGRGKRGRIFLPFVPEVFALDSKLTPAALTAYKAVAQKMQESPSQIEGSLPVLLPRQPAFLVNQLLPIIACRVLDNTCSRRDRRAPKRYFAIGAASGNAG